MATPTKLYLSTSDTSLARSVNLMSTADPDNGIFVVADGFKCPPPDLPNGMQTPPADVTLVPDRTVSMDILVRGSSGDALEQFRRSIEAMLRLAEDALGQKQGYWLGSPVVLWASELGSSSFVFFDVKSGKLVQKKRDHGPKPIQLWTLTLTCLGYAHGAPYSYPAVTLSNGLNCCIFIQGVPGDVDAPAQLIYTDNSINGLVLNGARWARRGYRYAQAGDFNPIHQTVALSPGASVADTTAMNGATTPQLTLNASWRSVCAASGGSAALDNGLFDVWAHVKSSATLLQTPQNVIATWSTAAGTLNYPYGVIVQVTALDASGNETAASDPLIVDCPGGNGELTLSWGDLGSPSNHNVYFQDARGGGLQVLKKATGSALSTYTLTSTTGTTSVGGAPSSPAPALMPALLQTAVALNAPTPVWSPPGDIAPLKWGGTWEWVYVGRFPAPPQAQQEGYAPRQYLLLLQARSPNSQTPTLSCDAFATLPATESQQVGQFPGSQLGMKRSWIFDTRRDLRTSGTLTDGGSPPAVQGQFQPRGTFTLKPGNNFLCGLLEGQNGNADVHNLTGSLVVRVLPRYMDLVGVVS